MKAIISACVIALVAVVLPVAAIGAVSRTLVLAVALMAAGVFPCMTVAVNAMKGEGRSPAMVQDLYDELAVLLKVLVVAFVLAILSVLALVATSAAIEMQAGVWIVKAIAAAAGASLGLFMGRVVAIGHAFFKLLEINKKQALLIVRGRLRKEHEGAIEASRKETFEKDDTRPRRFKKVG